jgi:hypothetical protein
MPSVSSKLRDRLRTTLRALAWRVLARVVQVAHPTNPSGNNRSTR